MQANTITSAAKKISVPAHVYILIASSTEGCKDTLKEIGELASKADDLRAQAVYNCCHFDALFDAGKFNIMTTTDVVSRLLHWSSIRTVLL